MEVKFSCYDTADYLKTEADITAYLDAVMEDGDPSLIAAGPHRPGTDSLRAALWIVQSKARR